MSDSNTDSSPNLIPESTTDSGGESVRELGSRSFGDRGGSARLSASQIQLQTCDPRAAIGSVICKDYEIREIIGEGGMAVVYKVRKISTGQIIAGKTLRFVEKALTERFLREIEIHTRLMHKNIVAPVEFAMTATGQAFFFMELLSGTSLEDVFARYGRIRRAIDIADILIQICQALSYAHSKGIVHRDIKPGNVIVNMSKEGVSVKVVDFGLAKLYEDLQRITKTGQVLGSPVYMSPEQCMGLTLDPRSDVYSLGILAYEMITGVLPYDGSSPVALMEQHCNPDKMPVPVQSKRVEMEGAKQANMIIFRALQSEPDSRFQSADQMRQAWLAWRALICGDSDNGYFARPEFSTYAVADSQVFASPDSHSSKPPVSAGFGAISTSSLLSELKEMMESPAPPQLEQWSDAELSLPVDFVERQSAQANGTSEAALPAAEELQQLSLDQPPIAPIRVDSKDGANQFARESLRELVSQRQDSQVKMRTQRFYQSDEFVSEQTPTSARLGDILLKALIFIVVSGGACALTLYLVITYFGE